MLLFEILYLLIKLEYDLNMIDIEHERLHEAKSSSLTELKGDGYFYYQYNKFHL